MGWTIQDPTLGIDVDWEDGDDPNRPPSSQDVWNIAKEIRTPYSLSALPDEVKINAAKHGFFETPETDVYSLLFGEMADDPETEIDETEAGIVQQMIEGGQKFSRQQLFNVTSSRRKLNIMQDRLGGETIPVKEDDPNLSQFQEAGKWLRGLQENWESTGPFGEWEPKGADYSQSLGKVGLKDTPTNRRKLIWSALNEDLLQSKADVTQGGAGALMTGPFVWYGGKKFLRKQLMDDADPQSILDYANAAIEFDKTNFYHEEGGEAVANFLGDEEVVNRIQEGTLTPDPEMSLAYMFLLDPMNLAGGGAAKLATSPFRIGLKGQVTKLAVGLQDNLAKKIELEAIQASRGIDSSLLVTRRAAEELAEVNAEIAEQQAKLGRYGGKSKTYNLGTLGLRKAPGQVLEAAGESLDLATDAGKQAYKMALEATDAAAQRTFSQLLLGQTFRGIGGTVEAMARTLEWVTRVPENLALSRIMAANKAAGRELTLKEATAELRSLKAAAVSGLAGAGLGYYVSETEGLLPGAAIAVLTKHLGPAALSKIGSVGRDMKVIGHEYSLAQTTDNLARRISKTPTPSVGLAAAEVDRAAALSTEGWFGIPGGVKGATAEVFPKKLPFREGLDTATEGIEAGAKGEARVVSETTRRVAKFLDDTGLAKAGQVGSTFAGGALKGTAIPAGIGFLAAGGEWEGALTGAVFSAPFTAIGAGAGTYARFRSKGEVYQKLLGDKAYYRDHLTKVEKKAFDSMSNEGQIAVASLSLSNPDAVVIPVNWGRDGAPGSHQVLKDSGESVIRLNVDSPKSLLYAMRHESMHHLEAHGLRPLVDSILFGDPLTDKVGFFTKLDENKQPVKAPIGEDGIQRWELSDDFYKYKEQYMERLRKTEGVDPDSVQKYEEDPTLIGREYFAEQGSDLMRTGELQKYLDRGPMAKLFGKVVETIQGREFTKNLLMKFGIPFDSTGKPLVGSGAAIFKDMKRVPELDKLIKKYANQVKNLRKEEIIGTKRPSGEREGGLAPLDFDQEASHAFSVEDIKDPHVLKILNTGGIFAHNPDGSIKEDAMGNPIRVTKKEAENARDPAVDHAISVLEKHGQEHLIETNAEGKKSATIHHLSDAMLDDLAAGPLHPRQVQTLRDIAKALREGDGEDAGMLIGYYSATEGRRPKPVSYAIRKAFPISFQITQGGNILVGLLDVARLQKNLTYLKKHFPAETRAFSNDNEVWSDFRTYAKNLANGVHGETGLTGDVAAKKNVLNALLGAFKKEQLVKNPILDKIGWKRANASGTRVPFGTGYKTFRLDRIFKSERSGKGIKFNQSAYARASEHFMPRRKPGQPDDTIPLPFDELPGDKPGEGFGRMINVDKSKSEMAEAKRLADEAQSGFSSSGNVRSKDAYGRDKLFMPAAYHGTPHTFKAEEGAPLGRFRSAQIGTGEGAQAYGHGLYFAGKKEVGEHYRNYLTRNRSRNATDDMQYILIDGEPVLNKYDIDAIWSEDASKVRNKKSAIKHFEERRNRWNRLTKDPDYQFQNYAQDKLSAYDKLLKDLKAGSKYSYGKEGSLYKVELAPKENEYLLWDKPLSEQPKGVREKLESMGLEYNKEMYPDPTGNDLYNFANSDKYSFGGDADKLSSAALREAGIPGIKYLDGSSRSKGKGDYNYVIFDEADVAITDKLFMPAAKPEGVSPNTVQSWDVDPSFPGKYTRGQAKGNDDVGKLFQEKYVEKYGEPIDPYDYKPETTGWLGGMLYDEAKVALARAGNAVDWYTKAVAKAMTIAEEIFPEIKTSAAAKDNFLGALAITSQNMRVLDNARAAVHQYDYKQKHGVFDYKKKHGGKAKMITENLRMFDHLEATLGSDFNAFLDKDFTVKELTEFGQKFFGKEKFAIEGRINDQVKGSAVFGPKIGQGFFQNLKGNYLPVTIDLWLRRTFGRLTGRSVSVKLTPNDIGRLIYSHRHNKGKRKAKNFELPEFLQGLKITGGLTKDGKMNFKITESAFERVFGEHEQGMANAEAVFDLTKELAKDWSREYSTTDRAVAKLKAELAKRKKAGQPVKQTAARLEKAEAAKAKLLEEKPLWAFASTSISGKLKPIDIPTPQERTVIVDAFNVALKKLKDEGYNLTPADLQATLWYPEKDIWAFLKGDKAEALNLSYDQAMEIIRDERR